MHFQFAHRYRQPAPTPPQVLIAPERPAPKSRGGALKLTRSYNFVDKVPVVDELRTLVERSGMTFQQMADASGVSRYCIWCLFNGKTVGPRRTTLGALAQLFGKRLGLIDDRTLS
jgi:hypothetical protein